MNTQDSLLDQLLKVRDSLDLRIPYIGVITRDGLITTVDRPGSYSRGATITMHDTTAALESIAEYLTKGA